MLFLHYFCLFFVYISFFNSSVALSTRVCCCVCVRSARVVLESGFNKTASSHICGKTLYEAVLSLGIMAKVFSLPAPYLPYTEVVFGPFKTVYA